MAAASKAAKASVNYSKGMKSAHCGICQHYLGGGRCALVAGTIDPAMWCRLFRKKRGA